MKQKRFSIAIVLACSLFAGCSDGDGLEEGSFINSYILSVKPADININADGSQQSMSITANCDWHLSGAAEWLTASTLQGNNSTTVSLSASPNTSANSRSCTLSLEGGNLKRDITVTQSGADAKLSVSRTSLSFDYKTGTQTFDIISNSPWTVSSEAEWCTVSPLSGSNNGSITVNVTQNSTEQTRTANIIVSGAGQTSTVIVAQNGGTRPVVTNLKMVSTTSSEASFSFSVTSAEPLTQCGLCYSESNTTPTLDDGHVVIDVSTGNKTATIKGLNKKTTYHVCAFAVSAIGTTYSDPVTIVTKSASPAEDDNGMPAYSRETEL